MLKTGSLLKCIGDQKKFLKCFLFSQNVVKFSSCKTLNSQPTPSSHPHLLNSAEISPLLNSSIYSRRRSELLQKIRSASDEYSLPQLLLIPSASMVYMSENIPYSFRQRTTFFYLSGLKEPDSVLLMSTNVTSQDECILFVPRQSPTSERWEGKKMSLKDCTKHFCVDQTLYLDDLEKHLQAFAKTSKKFRLWYDLSSPGPPKVQQVAQDFIQACREFMDIASPRLLIHECMLIKSPEERNVMRRTCEIGAESMKEVMKFSRSCSLESHLEARLDYECRLRGADRLAFPPVIAGGDRANTIHYIDNNQVLRDGELVLVDGGCEYGGYCSDLARTWPKNGKYTDPQRILYDLILSVQEELIAMITERPSLDSLFRVMCEKLGAGLQNLEIISKNLSKESVAQAAYHFCPHHVSHYLGMDVHDTSCISRAIRLLPGMVVTVEPGVYISRNDLKVPEKYRGICIRIEDDILVTENGFENLTVACPKHPDEVERLLN